MAFWAFKSQKLEKFITWKLEIMQIYIYYNRFLGDLTILLHFVGYSLAQNFAYKWSKK